MSEHGKSANGKGTKCPSECWITSDPQTRVRVWRITNEETINHNLYFLTSSFTPDQSRLVFTSYRSGSANFHAALFPDGEIVQLTEGEGVHGYSGVIDHGGERLFYTRGNRVSSVDLESLEERDLAQFEDGQLGEVSLSGDGCFLVSAMKRGGSSYLVVVNTDGSGEQEVFECERTIIHPQFHPKDSDLIEFAQDPAPRMWTVKRDGSDLICLWDHDNSEFLVHETFLDGDSSDLIVTRWPYALQRFDIATKKMSSIADFNAWHIASNKDGTKVLCDTVHPDIGLQLVDTLDGSMLTVCHPDSSSSGNQWLTDRYALAEDFAAAAAQGSTDDHKTALSWMEMKTDTVYGPQWTHPHPSFSPDETMVVYTSDVTGHPQVYVAEIPE